jgi:hypothetical protein
MIELLILTLVLGRIRLATRGRDLLRLIDRYVSVDYSGGLHQTILNC